ASSDPWLHNFLLENAQQKNHMYNSQPKEEGSTYVSLRKTLPRQTLKPLYLGLHIGVQKRYMRKKQDMPKERIVVLHIYVNLNYIGKLYQYQKPKIVEILDTTRGKKHHKMIVFASFCDQVMMNLIHRRDLHLLQVLKILF
ncbi:hypothetical protein ACJX0J_007098, partial [Zea mays]